MGRHRTIFFWTSNFTHGKLWILDATIFPALELSDKGKTPDIYEESREPLKLIWWMTAACVLVLVGISGCANEKEDKDPAWARTGDRLAPEQSAIPGRWGRAQSSDPQDQAAREKLAQLKSIGYVGGYNKPSSGSGVIVKDSARIQPGLTLFCSGHAPVALLMDLEGNIIHEWRVAFEDVWPEPLDFDVSAEPKEFLRRAHVYPNGDLLALFEYVGIVKLDKDSRVIWSSAGQHHHDFKILDNGTIVTLRRLKRSAVETTALIGENALYKSSFDDVIAFISPDGNEIRQISLLRAFHDSDHAAVLDRTETKWDLFHTNSVSIIAQPTPAHKLMFNSGDIMVSMRRISTVAVIDAVTGLVKWSQSGMYLKQHQAEYLANGNILLYDNWGGSKDFCDQDRSRIIEIDPMTQQIVWQFDGLPDRPFFSHWMGYNQRLPNGNTLITESTSGRLLEVAPDGEVVWEYVSPYRAGKDNELIATLMGAQRIAKDALPFLSDLSQ